MKRLEVDRIAAALAAVRVGLQAVALQPYGFFRDELYYLACARRPGWGYVDHPPLSVWVLKAWTAVFGESLVSIRLASALVEAAVVFLTVRLARAMGAGPTGAALAGVAVLLAPGFFGFGHTWSMNPLDHLAWTVLALLAVRLSEAPRPRDWLALGAALGLGFLNKWSVAWLSPGLAVGLALTPARAALRTPWPYAAIALAGALVAPNLLWQHAHGWPTLEFARNALEGKYVERALSSFAWDLARMMNPAAVPLALLGLAASRAVTALAIGAVLIVAGSRGGKAEYLLAAAPMLFAAGASLAERRLPRWVLAAAVVPMLALAALAYPFGVPVLSAERFVAYMKWLGVKPSTSEKKELAALPQTYADMHGWEELADGAAAAWATLSPDERPRAKLWAVSGGYGPAAALDHFGPARGLPPAIGSHNHYWLWGYGADDPGAAVVMLGGPEDRLRTLFETFDRVGTIKCGWCMPYENHKPVFVGRGMRKRWAEIWPLVKHYD